MTTFLATDVEPEPGRRTRWVRAWGLALALGLATPLGASGCATYSDRTLAARESLRAGDLDGSVEQFNKVLKVNSAEKLPDKWKKNFELVVLERATVLQALRAYDLSARDFQVADKQLELLDIARDGAGKIGKYIYSDSATKYKSSPTEKLSLNAMNMVNYLARGDLDGAKVEAKRFTVIRNYIRDYDPEHEHGAFGSYLAGFLYERLGNYDGALRYYEEALQERDFASLREVIPRLAERTTFRAERIEDYLPSQPAVSPSVPAKTPEPSPPSEDDPRPYVDEPPAKEEPTQESEDTPAKGELSAVVTSVPPWTGFDAMLDAAAPEAGEVLVVAKVGRVPFKEPRRIPIGAAIGIAGAFVTGDTTLLEYGMFKVVTYPELVPADNLFDAASLRIDGHAVPLDLATDLRREIIDEYEELKPKIIGAALTRMIARAAAAEGARAAGRQAEGAGGLVGFLAAAAVEGTLVALDKPDTRSWTTLPAKVFVGRTRLPAGTHQLEVTVSGPGGREVRTVEVKVPAGGFVVFDVTTLR